MAVKQTGNSLRTRRCWEGNLRNGIKNTSAPYSTPRADFMAGERKGAGRVLAELEWRYIESERFDEGVIQSPCEE